MWIETGSSMNEKLLKCVMKIQECCLKHDCGSCSFGCLFGIEDDKDCALKSELPEYGDCLNMIWYETAYRLPTHSRLLIIDCVEGVGEGYYKGKGMFHFNRFNEDVDGADVYRWANMPTHDELERECE